MSDYLLFNSRSYPAVPYSGTALSDFFKLNKLLINMAKREPIEPSNIFRCSCGDDREMEFVDFKGHLLAAHNLKPEQLKGTKQMMVHLNGEGFHSYTYDWTLNSGLKFRQFVTRPKTRP